MPAMLILAAAAMGLVLVVLAAVVVGIRQEPSSQQLTGHTPRLMARMTRRLVGVYVRRPDPVRDPDKQHAEPGHTAHDRSSAGRHAPAQDP
jgi:K+-sensing histidine kinase KdpD